MSENAVFFFQLSRRLGQTPSLTGRSLRSGLHFSCGGRKETLFSQVCTPGPFNCKSASHARELEQEVTGKGLPLWGQEQGAAKNVLEK